MWTVTIQSPVGRLRAVASENGLRALLWPNDEMARFAVTTPLVERPDHPTLARLVQQLAQYFDGARPDFDVPLDAIGTEFQRLAWSALRRIPYGTTRSYGEQAVAIGRPGAARAVGAANGRNPLPIVVPCHRVVGADGRLTGFGGGIDVKRFLLEHESSEVVRAAGRPVGRCT